VRSSKIPCHPPTPPLPPVRFHHQPQPQLLLYRAFSFIITFVQRAEDVLPGDLGRRAEEPEMGVTSTKAAHSWSKLLGITKPQCNLSPRLQEICILQSFPS